jgi:2-(1,2-epoxy-1,2-dihydrophenyl)acetyl-CoA isomerase
MQATQNDPAWAAKFHSLVGQLNQVIMLIRNLDKPVIVAVHGFASGAGFSLALACDLRLAAVGTRFNQAYVNLGLTPDGGSTYFLTELLGPAKALDLIFTGRMLETDEAVALGLLNEVLPEADLVDRAKALALELAKGPALAYGLAKRLVYASQRQGLATQLELEQQSIVDACISRDFREGLAAFEEKRKPVFKGI